MNQFSTQRLKHSGWSLQILPWLASRMYGYRFIIMSKIHDIISISDNRDVFIYYKIAIIVTSLFNTRSVLLLT